MVQLISVVVFIAIMGIVFLGGDNHIPIQKLSEISIKSNIMNGYQTLKQGQMIYREHTDSYLPIGGWKSSFESYAFIPQDVSGLTWDYNKNSVGYYFCLTGNVNEPSVYNSLKDVGSKMGKNSYFLNEDCGSSTNFIIEPDLSTTPKISATFFIK